MIMATTSQNRLVEWRSTSKRDDVYRVDDSAVPDDNIDFDDNAERTTNWITT